MIMGRFQLVTLFGLALLGAPLGAQQYDGPVPPKADVPYLLHADSLVEMEKSEARQEQRKKETAYVVTGAASPARTPLAEPIFILLSESLEPKRLKLYSMNVVNGSRETAFPLKASKDTPRPRHLTYKKLDENLYWVETNEYLDNGEYCLTPDGSNDVFCFQIY